MAFERNSFLIRGNDLPTTSLAAPDRYAVPTA